MENYTHHRIIQLLLIGLFVVGYQSNIVAQNNIIGYEYWFNQDFGGRNLVATTPTLNLQLNSTVPTGNLSMGINTLQIRFKDANNHWSPVMSQNVVKVSNKTVFEYEYWFDDAINNRTHITNITASNGLLMLNDLLSTANLNTGFHRINIRIKNKNGSWSPVISETFIKTPDKTAFEYEYWFDDAINNRTNVTNVASANGALTLNSLLPSTGIGEGLHDFHFRIKNKNGSWSPAISQVVYILESQLITGYEYWFDNDFSGKNYVSLSTPSNLLNFTPSINAASLPNGWHRMHIRFEQGNGLWSPVTSDSVNVQVTAALPVAAFTFTTNNLVASFSTQSQNATSHLWDFGDGNTSTTNNPTHTYSTSGTFTVKLVVTNATGSDSISHTVQVNSPCFTPTFWTTPAASSDDATLIIPIASNPTANGNPLPIGTLIGLFDDSGNLWGLETWNGVTNISISARGNDGSGNGFNNGDTIRIKAQLPNGIVTDTVLFSYSPISPTISQMHTYINGGILGLTSFDATYTPLVAATPTANFNYTNTGLSYNFNNSSVDALTYSWDFGDGSTSNQTNPIHIFTTAGTYNVCLYASNACGTDTTCQTVTIVPIVACADLPVISNVASSSPTNCNTNNGAITITATSANPMEFSVDNGLTWQSTGGFTGLSSGNYAPLVRNISDTCLAAWSVISLVQPSLLSISGVITQTPSFCNANDGSINLTASGSTILNYSINGNTPQSNGIFNNLIAGNYTISIDNGNNTCSIDTTITLSGSGGQTAIAAFEVIQSGLNVILKNNSTDADSSIWMLGDGTIFNQNDTLLTHTYTNDGNYTICLTAKNACGDSIFCQNITVNKPCNNITTTWNTPIATGENATIIFPVNALTSANENPIVDGTLIGIFDQQDSIWGMGIFQNGQNFSIAVYGNDGNGQGFNINENYILKAQLPNGLTTNEVIATFETPNNGLVTNTNQYNHDGVSVITALMLEFGSTDTTLIDLETCDATQAGIFTQNLTNQYGCDSVIITTNTLLTSDTTRLTTTTCDPSQAGVSTIINQNINNCDSVIITTTTLELDTTTLTVWSCTGQVGQVITFEANEYGCDSMIVTNYFDVTTLTNVINLTTCNPSEIGQTVDSLHNQYGCDSVIITNVILESTPSNVSFQNAFTCDAAAVGVDTATYGTASGCDSVVITTTLLNSFPNVVSFQNAFTCDAAAVGVDTATYGTASGCDSVVITTTLLNPFPNVVVFQNAFTCDAGAVGIDTATYGTASGCDSVVITTTLLNSFPNVVIFQNAFTCDAAAVGVDTAT
ncbi:MAG: PKD domain-containing protein, partial [Saprospiraceae bacterium]